MLAVINSISIGGKTSSFQEIDYIIASYFSKNKRELRKLLRIRTGHVRT